MFDLEISYHINDNYENNNDVAIRIPFQLLFYPILSGFTVCIMIIQCKFDMKELSIGKLSLECQVTDSMKYFLNKRKHLNFSFIYVVTLPVYFVYTKAS